MHAQEVPGYSRSVPSLQVLQAVREAVSIPMLANGNVRHLQDAYDLMAYTGAAGVMSAESLLDDPALFSPRRLSSTTQTQRELGPHAC